MPHLPQLLAAWETPAFEGALKAAVAGLGRELPLQEGLAAGSYAQPQPLDVVVIHTGETPHHIEAKVGIFYTSLMPGCACAGDPTVEDAQTEYIVLRLSVDRKTAEARISLIRE